MQEPGKLTIATANVDLDQVAVSQYPGVAPGPYVRLTVADTGVGMDEETRNHIFEPFFTSRQNGSGTGLGLSIVYGIIQQNNGWIRVESELGKGAAFEIFLPRINGCVLPAANAQNGRVTIGGSQTILIVEDQEEVRRFASEVLRFYGYCVMEAPNGTQALKIAHDCPKPIHLLLTDVVMPDMNGRELADALHPLRPEMLILYMSGYSEDVIAHRGVVDREIAYLSKPFTPATLAMRVSELLRPSAGGAVAG
jgi:CheY-like chemotaxis protein